MFGNKVVVGSVEISQTPWRGSESTALSSCREVSRPRQVEAGTLGSAGFVYRKHLYGEGFQGLLLPWAVAGICGVGPRGHLVAPRTPHAGRGGHQTPVVLSNRGATWAFVRILALSRPCVMTWLYDGPLNKG